MKKKSFFVATSVLILFALWTLLVSFIDVCAIGPEGSFVGFGALNGAVHNLTGVNMTLYTITDWLGLVPIATALSFAILGFVQLIKRRSLFKVDYSIRALGIFYITVMAFYAFFELVVINYRPILIDGVLEASYPSSTTILVTTIMPTAMMQLKHRIKNLIFKRIIFVLSCVFIGFMVVGRLLSGVHWVTDIIAGLILSIGLVLMYYSLAKIKC